MNERTCIVADCEKRQASRQWCHMHYWRFRKHGDVNWTPSRPTPEERFWPKVDIQGPDECWLWTGGTNRGGYGTFQGVVRGDGAHRFAWELANGPIPEGMVVRHLVCDNPPCVNAKHLSLGTHEDNMADMRSKDRGCVGDRNGTRIHSERVPRGDEHWSRANPEKVARGASAGGAKLTTDKVREIRRLRSGGLGQREIAEQFAVSQAAIQSIISGRNWRHVV